MADSTKTIQPSQSSQSGQPATLAAKTTDDAAKRQSEALRQVLAKHAKVLARLADM